MTARSPSAPGAPPSNATFFCEPSSGLCYAYLSRQASWERQRAACRVLGGDLVKWDSPDKQLAAEAYFQRQGSLTLLYYWMGLRRANASAAYAFLDGSSLPQVPSNTPYAHWNWYQPVAANHSDYHCVMAYNAYR